MPYEGQRFLYEYGIKHRWQIEVRIEQLCVLDTRRRYPICIAGKRSAPPEQYAGAEAFMQACELHKPAYVNERMLTVCDALLNDKLYSPEWQAEIEAMQSELAQLRYWLIQEDFSRRTVNQHLKEDKAVSKFKLERMP